MSRWGGLFADLEAQLEAAQAADLGAEVDARVRGELADLVLVDRLRAAVDTPVRLWVAGGLVVAGTLERVGADWCVVVEDTGREAVVLLAALRRVAGLGRWAAAEPGPVAPGAPVVRAGLRSVLRAIARDRGPVRAHLVDGEVVDATLDRVGADHVDLAVHAAGEARRARDVRAVHTVPFAALAALRRDPTG